MKNRREKICPLLMSGEIEGIGSSNEGILV